MFFSVYLFHTIFDTFCLYM